MLILLPGNDDPAFADAIADEFGYRSIHTDVIRDPVTGLLSDSLTVDHIAEELKKNSGGTVLSAYPHSAIQAQSLDNALAQRRLAISIAVARQGCLEHQDRHLRGLYRYYRTQNKLYIAERDAAVDKICKAVMQIYLRRRSPAISAEDRDIVDKD